LGNVPLVVGDIRLAGRFGSSCNRIGMYDPFFEAWSLTRPIAHSGKGHGILKTTGRKSTERVPA
jgi:hypothetical protein